MASFIEVHRRRRPSQHQQQLSSSPWSFSFSRPMKIGTIFVSPPRFPQAPFLITYRKIDLLLLVDHFLPKTELSFFLRLTYDFLFDIILFSILLIFRLPLFPYNFHDYFSPTFST